MNKHIKNFLLHINEIPVDELSSFNNSIVKEIKARMTLESKQKARLFSIGDVVEFDGKRRGTIRMRITSINQKTVIGNQLTPDGNEIPFCVWKVDASIVRKS